MQNHLSFPNVSIGNMVFQAVRTRFPLRIVAGMTRMGSFAIGSIVIRAISIQLPALHTDEDLVRLVQEAEVKNINPERLRVIRHEVVT